MRRHAKASSAGSTTRRARSLGRTRVLAAALASLALLALAPTFAAAAVDPEYFGAFGPDGTEGTTFEGPAAVAVDEATGVIYVGDQKKQVLYKFDSEGNPLDWTGSAGYISGNEISGLSFSSEGFGERTQVAVDPETHVLYVTSANKVRAFEASGEAHEFTAGPGATTSEIPGASTLGGVAVDANGVIYAADTQFAAPNPKIRIYSRTGALLTEFVPKADQTNIKPSSLAVAPDGSLYVVNSGFLAYRLEPSQFPVTASTTYSLGEPLNALNEGFTFSVAVDPTTSYVYVGERLSGSSQQVAVLDEDDKPVGALGGPGEAGEITGNPVDVAVNGGSERVYAVDRKASSAEPFGQVKVFESFTYPVTAPTIVATSVIDLDLYTATLRARINPNTLETTYHFEYGLEDCSLSTCTSTPEEAMPPAHKPLAATNTEIEGLQPGTTYHYRVVAENAEGTTEGPDKTFTTPRSGQGFSLADSRAWEMVSPPNKFGSRLLQFSQGAMQAAANGNGVAYESVTSIEPNPDGNRAIDISTVLARRGAGGNWSSKDITPFHAEASQLRFGGEYKTFSSNLERALLEQPDNTLLSPEASEETPYLRENTEPGTYRPLVTAKEGFANVPPGTVFGGIAGSGASPVAIRAADPALMHPVIKSRAPLVPGAAPGSLYQWDDGQLQPISELPASEGGAIVFADAGAGIGSVHNAVSEDGSRVFWAEGQYVPGGRNFTGLYVRDTVAQTSGRLDVAQPGAGEGASRPAFGGASADGSVVYFLDSQRLTTDASPPASLGVHTFDLYRCEVGPVEGGILGCTDLTDISAPMEGSGEEAEVVGTVPGVSEDGARVYFVAKGVLDTTPNEAGESAVAGEPNLYLWEEGEGRRYIATLSERDRGDWRGTNANETEGREAALSASPSPDGRYFGFMSERSLTGYDNHDAKSDEPVEEVFRYDAEEDRLDCVSCNPSGASPEGKVSDPTGIDPPRADTQSNWSKRWVAAVLPTAQESEPTLGLAFHRPRVVHDNGRVFFNAIDPLVSADSNGEWDVYQWEPIETGDCTSTSEGAAIARSAGGCVSLVSSGTSEEEASFVDASEGGDDVFFITPARLSVTDEDFELDVYDARVDGIPATLPVINECQGEACQPAPNPPNDPTPTSASFHGSGNVPSERCAEGKRRVTREGHSRCVAKKHKHKKKRSHKAKKAKRANNNRRAGR